MAKTLTNFVDGKVAALDGRELELVDPVTEEVFATAAISSEQEIDSACQAAARAFESWGQTTPSERQLALLKIADAIEARAEQLVEVESANTGKPKALVLSEELPPMVDQIRFFAGAARVLEGSAAGEYMAGYTSFIRREPIGVCAAVTPWNYPAMMAVWKWAPALAAGNTMVLKPSDTTPASTVWMAELMAEFLPAGVFNVVLGDRDTGAALVRNKIPQMVSITGSVRAGMAVAASAASDVKRVHLELGGKAPVVIFDDADLAKAAEEIAVAGYFNAGQDCTAATRVLVSPRVHEEFVGGLVEQAKGTVTGDPDDENVLYGPLNNATQLGHVTGMVDRTPDHAKVVTGGHRARDRGYFFEPTVIDGLAGGRAQPDRDLRTGHHRAAVHRRGRSRALGERRPVRARLERVDEGPRPRDARVQAPELRLRVDQHPHPARRRDAARRVQALRIRQGPIALRLRGLHADQARDEPHRGVSP